MKNDVLILSLLMAIVAACGSNPNRSGDGPLQSNTLGGVHVGNPVNGTVASGGSNTFSSPNGFEIPVRSNQSLKLTSKDELSIQTEQGAELFVRVIGAEQGPRSLADFEEFVSSLPNPNQFDRVEASDSIALAIRKLVVEQKLIEERVILSPNKKILWIRSQTSEKDKNEFQNNIERIAYDLTAPVMESPELSYDPENLNLYMQAKILKNHAQHDVRVQIWLENQAETLISVDRMVVTQLILQNPKDSGRKDEPKLPAKTKVGFARVDLKAAHYQVTHMIIWDPIGNRRIFMAPPFGNFYQMSVIPISKDESERNKIEPTRLNIVKLNVGSD
jgi:hypothetical protein